MNLRGHLAGTRYLRAAGLVGIGVVVGMSVLAVPWLWARVQHRSLTRSWRYLEPRQVDGIRYDRGSDVESREARLAALALSDQNKLLRQEILEIEEQVRQLTMELASARVEVDRVRLEEDRAELGVGGRLLRIPLASEEIGLIDVNRGLRMAVLDVGALRGVRPGMCFDVLRDGRYVARLRAVDVREMVTGAVIEDLQMQYPPVKGDRVIPRRVSED